MTLDTGSSHADRVTGLDAVAAAEAPEPPTLLCFVADATHVVSGRAAKEAAAGGVQLHSEGGHVPQLE